MNMSKVKGLHKSIKKILNEMHPECEVEGHRVHTTFTKGDELWPDWGNFVIGIAGAFVHFEDEKDSIAWHDFQDGMLNGKDEVEVEEEVDLGSGRCVSECGPIGFRGKAA